MAGAERPKSIASTMLAMIDFEKGEEPTIAGQGMIINYELSQVMCMACSHVPPMHVCPCASLMCMA